MLAGWMALCLSLAMSTGSTNGEAAEMAVYTTYAAAATAEYDAELRDWQGGQELQLRHPLFDLTRVAAGSDGRRTILFSGTGHGTPGEISMVFRTIQGDRIYSPPGSITVARVDEKHREFQVAALIPTLLRGREGVVQVTFMGGGRRASYLLKVHF